MAMIRVFTETQIGHNDDPTVAGMGSAIFVHVAAADYPPTGGCVALAADDLESVIADCDSSTHLLIMIAS